MKTTLVSITLIACAVSLAGVALARTGGNDGRSRSGRHHGRPPEPPAAAFDACKDRAEGDACSVTFRDQTLEGECHAPPNSSDSQLVCLPTPPPPPEEAVAACEQHAAGDACSVTFQDRTVEGICVAGRTESDPLACFPDAPPPPPRSR
jgi:hypothetical protein